MNVPGNIANQLSNNNTIPYNKDFLSSVQLLENAGFAPFTDSSPMNSTLYQIFDRFVERTGLNTNSNVLKDDFLKENPSSRQAIYLYDTLENTFATRGTGERALIVDFLNKKIDQSITDKDIDESGTLTAVESGINESLFQDIDADGNNEINAQEMKNNFFNDFTQFNSVLNYFRNTSGNLVDTYA